MQEKKEGENGSERKRGGSRRTKGDTRWRGMRISTSK
jgi:hypothetical protein